MVAGARSGNAQTLQWHATNGPYGGTVSSIAQIGTITFVGTSSSGLFRSDDSAKTWTQIQPYSINDLFTRIYSFKDTLLSVTTDYGIFRSLDSGQTWQGADTFQDNCRILGVSDTLIIGQLTAGGYFRSFDGGSSWQKLNWNVCCPSACCITGASIFIANSVGGLYGGIIHSSDYGATWKRVDTNFHDYSVYFLRQLGETLYAGVGNSILRSTDAGVSWNTLGSVDSGLLCYDMSSIGGRLFLGTSKGLYRSSDSGNHWQAIDTGAAFHDIDHFLVSGKEAFACGGQGILHSTDAGNSWSAANIGFRGQRINAIQTFGRFLYAGTNLGLYQSSDEGDSWNILNLLFRSVNVTDLSLHRSNLFVQSQGGAYRSNDSGASWQALDSVAWFGNLGSCDQALYVGNFDGIWRSTNTGNSWDEVDTLGQIGLEVGKIICEGNLVATLIGGFYPYFSMNMGETWNSLYPRLTEGTPLMIENKIEYFSTQKAILRSADSGQRWDTVARIPNCRSLLIDQSFMIAGTSDGAFLSADSGLTWLPASNGLGKNDINKLTSGEKSIFGVSSNQIIFRTQKGDLSAVPSSSLASNEMNLRCFPNPTSSIATLQFNLPSSSIVTLSVFDILGREIATLLNGEYMEAGMHEIPFNLPEMGTGIYNVVIRTSFGEKSIKISHVR